MDVVKSILVLALSLTAPALRAETFSLTIGNTIAAQGTGDIQFKKGLGGFVFRVNGCADLSKAQITASAEGTVGGARKTTSISPAAAQPSVVYAVPQRWGNDGKWIVAI